VCGNNPFVDIIALGMGAQTIKKKIDEMAFFGAHLSYKKIEAYWLFWDFLNDTIGIDQHCMSSNNWV
jgi:hypothetical protein